MKAGIRRRSDGRYSVRRREKVDPAYRKAISQAARWLVDNHESSDPEIDVEAAEDELWRRGFHGRIGQDIYRLLEQWGVVGEDDGGSPAWAEDL